MLQLLPEWLKFSLVAQIEQSVRKMRYGMCLHLADCLLHFALPVFEHNQCDTVLVLVDQQSEISWYNQHFYTLGLLIGVTLWRIVVRSKEQCGDCGMYWGISIDAISLFCALQPVFSAHAWTNLRPFRNRKKKIEEKRAWKRHKSVSKRVPNDT